MKPAVGGEHDYTDGRRRWDWDSHYSIEARKRMKTEAISLVSMLAVTLLGAGICLGLSDQSFWLAIGGGKVWVSFRLLAIFCVGSLGAVTFSIKWLIHAVA
jgi:hypothetical protein